MNIYSQVPAEVNDCSNDHSSFFVKVYMEGIPIGRKLNILAHGGYYELVRTLEHMFDTTILCKSIIATLSHFCRITNFLLLLKTMNGIR